MNEERCDYMDRKSFDSIRIEIAGAEDMNEIRKLWKQSFDDQDAYMDYYFSSVAIRNQIFVAKNGSKIISMVHLNPYTLAETTAGVTAYKKGGCRSCDSPGISQTGNYVDVNEVCTVICGRE